MMPERSTAKRTARIPRCPICDVRTDATREAFPFCSPRCRQLDLARWLNGQYCISRDIEQADLDEV